ncbi:putative glycosyltransferase [Ananas comosus]|uniref:Putative glycosyltransferase n=1 Tax=Ananas comosus TaxID=4615 RepID=A0A199VST7_ANACO|nr:putative glycosyltransferase [Ananas comosus]
MGRRLRLRLRLRRGRGGAASFSGWRRRIAAAAIVTAAITALIAFAVPSPLTIGFFFFPAADSSGGDRSPPPPPLPLLHPLPRRAASALASILANSTSRSSASAPPPPPIGNSGSPKANSSVAYWRMSPDEALAYAKKEIENAPLVVDDPDLYAPLFRNVSAFKRSYELMERILKVYIYQDGQVPIFHTPDLKGIYASEGWFLKLMEEDRRFTVKDPSKAHLFYLPYSSRQLQLAIYVPGSHNLRPLSLFLRDYVNTIAAKYPFWNRTRGRDHFLVACHDWGPYTTTAHEELLKNTIKALCNADSSEGIFIRGRDVSLPETTIRTPNRPQRYVGKRRVSQRPFLAFFAGNVHGRVRPILLKYWDGKDDDMRIYGPLPNRVSRQMSYVEHMKSSKFCICPMGYEVNSPRIVEAIYSECVPVIIADNFVLPFNEVLNWSAFSVVIAEKDIPNLKNILSGISLRRYLAMHTCVSMLQKHFLWHAKPLKYDLFHMVLHSIWFNRLKQIEVQEQ